MFSQRRREGELTQAIESTVLLLMLECQIKVLLLD